MKPIARVGGNDCQKSRAVVIVGRVGEHRAEVSIDVYIVPRDLLCGGGRTRAREAVGDGPVIARLGDSHVGTNAAASEDVLLEVVGTRSRRQEGRRCKRGYPTDPQAAISDGQAGLDPL